jgi:hypothetical protein
LRRAQREDARPTTLTYIYWEPVDAQRHAVFAQHRSEAEEFAQLVRDADLPCRLQSYEELWEHWLSLDKGLDDHVARLRERYAVSING